MADADEWAFPERLQPNPDEVGFDLPAVLDSVVQLRAEVPEDAFTASILGTVRVGNGVVIDEDGLVLTIGYLVTEAQSVWLTTNAGTVVPGHPLAYDQVTGFGLVMPLGSLGVQAITRGTAQSCPVGSDVYVVGHGGRPHALKAAVVSKREFAGYWEYVLDEAVFTTPAHPQWGGAALVSESGHLLGVGSLLVQEVVGSETVQGNMVVPIDILEPILPDLLRLGRADRSPRPWLGMYTSEAGSSLIVGGLAENGPAARAGIEVGDRVLEVAGERVASLADLFRRIWSRGPAGTEVPITVRRDGTRRTMQIRSADRNDFLKKPLLH